ncbi:chemotaxis protein CheA [Leptospira sp. GIMC2001]|uniref:chemotaxis protein CheA n=1 Tax=Leptospira sp. GIMC2001 TaxID=1513297 RepID=UPI0004A5C2F6|nr:chemotaxis protein CheA [Leptospira sp. GIMC2001]AID56264.1 signal transduction histidine kinase CheA [Leptospira sp. GIMC2001]WCL47848.1 chemotaxis protein CheA [Leptospira sp. GIMC2001]
MDLDEIVIAFVQESEELLIQMEDLLLVLETDHTNIDAINGVFRSIHTIKGTAGMFGFHAIVDFTHVVENLLDDLRSGKSKINEQIIELLLKTKDYLLEIIKLQADGNPLSNIKKNEGDVILKGLMPFLATGNAENKIKQISESNGNSEEISTVLQTDTYHISLRPKPEIFQNALDPIPFLKYLKQLGEIVYLKTIVSSLPEWKIWNPENCYLGFEIRFRSDANLEEIRKAFEFLEYDSLILILPPKSSMANLRDHISKLPEDEIFISNLLFECGTINREELIFLLETYQSDITGIQPQIGITKIESTPTKNTNNSANQGSSLRVDSERVDYLINKVGELVVAEANLNILLSNKEDSSLTESLHSVGRLVSELREISLKLRMVPIGDSFNKYHRIVRDLGSTTGKKVKLNVSGGETELDKSVVERISDPLVHIVRNAIDHGLETSEERQKAGKNPTGNLHLNAFHDTGSIVIEIWDDGRGINESKVLAKAIEKGIVAEDKILNESEIHRLLFHPGFSTADTITNISGRGVGLDVVLKNIEALRGSVDVESKPNLGTKFTIRLPLTLAIIDGFLVGMGQDLYVIPLDMVRECVEFADENRTIDQSGNFFNLRGKVLPFVRLDEFFHKEKILGQRENIVITEFQGIRIGLVVDKLYGEIQTVIKPLAKVFEGIRGIGGSTTLGDGSIALILDIPNLHNSLKEAQEMELA